MASLPYMEDLGRDLIVAGMRRVVYSVHTSRDNAVEYIVDGKDYSRPAAWHTSIMDPSSDDGGLYLYWPDEDTALRNHALLVQIIHQAKNPYDGEEEDNG